VPKVESAGDLAFVDRLLDGVERAAGYAQPLRVQALIETAAGVRRLDEITRASGRLEAILLGYADLAASLGRPRAGALELDLWLPVQDAVVGAARAAGVQAIDGPFFAIDDPDGLQAACNRAARLGFDGKWAIHPSQLEVIAAAFTPTDEEIEHARSVLATLASAAGNASGAASVQGEMVDEALALAARRTLSRAGAVQAR
jgi:citrate lyase subunit beta/citryl-CoA lyase